MEQAPPPPALPAHTKSNPGPYDCYNAAKPDEPIFVLLGRDKHAPALVWLWAVLREIDSEDAAKVAEARDCALSMIAWAADNGRKSCGLGVATLAGAFELIRAANFSAKERRNDETSVDLLRRFLTQTELENNEL